MVSNTSKMAYDDLVRSGKELTQRGQILRKLIMHPEGYTRRQLSYVTSIELGAVAGRVNALVADGLVDDSTEVICHVTKKTVKLIKPIIERQQEMF